jgi:hypothetical protein
MQHLASVRRTITGEPQLMPCLTPRGFLDILTMDLLYDPDSFIRRLNQARHNYSLSRGEEIPRSAVPASEVISRNRDFQQRVQCSRQRVDDARLVEQARWGSNLNQALHNAATVANTQYARAK